MRNLVIEEMGAKKGNRTRYSFSDKNNKGEKIVVELSHCILSYSLGKIWKEKKYISRDLETWINIDVYVTNSDNICVEKYNPQIINIKNKHGVNFRSINFEWVIEDNEINRTKILNEIERLAFEN